MSAPPKAIFLLPNYGFDPTEAGVPWVYLADQGCDMFIATEKGEEKPECDRRLVEGLVGAVLGPSSQALEAYHSILSSPAFKKPLSWSDPSFTLDQYDILVLPGGHDKGVKQLIESPPLKKHLREFVEKTGPGGEKVVGAICHGVLALAWTNDPVTGHSIIRDRRTTTLPKYMEELAYFTTKPLLGEYYRTYAGRWTETMVTECLTHPDQFERGPVNVTLSKNRKHAHVVVDEGYISGRWPGDAQVFAEKIWEQSVKRRKAAGPDA